MATKKIEEATLEELAGVMNVTSVGRDQRFNKGDVITIDENISVITTAEQKFLKSVLREARKRLLALSKVADITARVKAMDDDELTRFVRAFDSPLSGNGIGEGAAFQLMAEIEGIAIAEYQARGLAGQIDKWGRPKEASDDAGAVD